MILSVPGGLAGQLFAVAYGAWISKKLGKTAHIQFHDIGTEIAKFGLGNLLETPKARNLGLSYSQVAGNWPPMSSWNFSIRNAVPTVLKSSLPVRLAKGAFLGTRGAYQGWLEERSSPLAEMNFPVITKGRLIKAQLGEVIVGYPTDYQIVEEAWDILSALVQDSDMLDFSDDCGLEESVAIHWRLGDYVQNNVHGAVSWTSLETCLRNSGGSKLPVKIFTDSPEIAREAVGTRLDDRPHEFISNQIWEDLVGMTRSKIFIGTHSGVSVLAAMALRNENPDSRTWLPHRWFADRASEYLFFPAKKTFRKSSFYFADLVTNSIPI